MRADRVGGDTVLAQIVAMVADAQRNTRADSAARGSDRGLFRSGGAADGACSPLSPGACGDRSRDSRTALRQRRGRADHRVPVRARARDADGDHGGHRPRRRRRRAGPERGGARAARNDRRARRRQDRHADRGQAAADGGRGRRAVSRSRRPAVRRRDRAGERASARRGGAGGRARPRDLVVPTASAFDVRSRPRASSGMVEGHAGRSRQRRVVRRARHRRPRARATAPTPCARAGRRSCCWRSTARRPGSSASPIRSRRPPREAIHAAAPGRPAAGDADRRQHERPRPRSRRRSASTR